MARFYQKWLQLYIDYMKVRRIANERLYIADCRENKLNPTIKSLCRQTTTSTRCEMLCVSQTK